MAGDDKPFLARWADRKAGLEPEVTAEPEPAPPATPEPPDDRTDEEILADLGLPDPTTLQPGDDVKGFMSAAVPDRLRRIALRQLWRGNPVLANLDELVEYGEDYTDAATVVENMQTLYQVGKGIFREPATDEELAKPPPGQVDTAEEKTPPETELAALAEAHPEADAPAAPAGPAARRRMAFRFDQS